MSDRPLTRDFREGPTTDISLVLFGPRWFSGEKSVDVIKAQPNIETPTMGEAKKP